MLLDLAFKNRGLVITEAGLPSQTYYKADRESGINTSNQGLTLRIFSTGLPGPVVTARPVAESMDQL